MGALTKRDVLFLLLNAAIGLAVGAVMVRWPDLGAPIPPVLWLVLGMAIVEISGAALLGLGGPLVTYGMRILGLAVAFGAYFLVSAPV